MRNCCKKKEEEGQEEFYLKKIEKDDFEKIKKLVSPKWYNNKGEEASFILYEKIDNIGEGLK